jgi:hypothetical protein
LKPSKALDVIEAALDFGEYDAEELRQLLVDAYNEHWGDGNPAMAIGQSYTDQRFERCAEILFG